MRLGIMQPYFFPYIGYFQYIWATDKFIFCDDVNFIKGGWVNRNRILINGQPHFITINLKNASQFDRINQIRILDNRYNIIKTIERTYKKAPFYNDFMPILTDCLTVNYEYIYEIAEYSVVQTCNYLGINKEFEQTSIKYSDLANAERGERIFNICQNNKAHSYINPMGGMPLYCKNEFGKRKINLCFIDTKINEYKQFKFQFVPGLSIIDVIMFNDKEAILNSFLNNYELI